MFATVNNILTQTKFTWDDNRDMLLDDNEHAWRTYAEVNNQFAAMFISIHDFQ